MDTQLRFINKGMLLWSSIFLLLLIFSYFVYLPGISGIFIFDDIPNLTPLGKYSDFGFWNDFWIFLLEGDSGPTGRPVSLASFYLNDTSWPSLPLSFIQTNILIHLLNGVLVFWVCLKLANRFKLNNNYQIGFSLLITSFWLLHPMHTTTVLYIIQRMTELSATFMLIGLVFYLYGREQLDKNTVKGFLTLFIGVGSSLILAILSKENGILLVAYILVIEFFLFQPLNIKPPVKFYYWLVPAVILPFLVILIYLGLRTNPGAFINRDFTLEERLLTEPRILFDYLYHILVPKMNYITIFHDDFELSKSIFKPMTTFFSVIGLLLLVLFSFAYRKKIPFVSFAIAWFFAGHLIESTVLPLELYFEHRNYLPMLGIFILLGWYASLFIERQKSLVASIAIIMLLLNVAILFQNTTLWGNPLELGINWYQNHPKSERSRLLYVSVMEAAELPVKPKDKHPLTDKNSQFYSTSAFLELKNACIENTLTETQLNKTVNIFESSVIHISAKTRFLEFINEWEKGKCKVITPTVLKHYLKKLASLDNIKKHGQIAHDVHYVLSNIYKKEKDFQSTMLHLDKAYSYSPSYELLNLKIATLLSGGLYNEALKVLNDTSKLKTTFRKKLAMKIRQKELDQLKQFIQNKIRQQQANNT